MTELMKAFSARPLFTLVAEGMNRNVYRHQGAFGTRSVASPTAGRFQGERLSGTLIAGLASEWQIESEQVPGLAHVDGLVTLLPSDGAAVLMKYRGRRSPRDGASKWRATALFEAPEAGPYAWLTGVLAAIELEAIGADVRFTVHELLGRGGPESGALPVEPLYVMEAGGGRGKRHIITSAISTRFMTVADEGVTTTGRLATHWPIGFAWGPHSTGRSPEGKFKLPLQIDMRVALVTGDGQYVLQQYMGANVDYDNSVPVEQRFWKTAAVFEAPAGGPLAYLNEAIALGVGWVEDQKSRYVYGVWT